MRSWLLLLACLLQLAIDSSLGWNKQNRWGGEPQQHYYPPMRAPPGPPMGNPAHGMPRRHPPQSQPSWHRYMRGGPMYDPNPQEGYPGPPLLSDPGYLNFRKFRAVRCNPPPTPPPNYYHLRNMMLQNPRLDISISYPDSDQDCECMDKTYQRLYQAEYVVKPQYSERCNDGRANNMICVCNQPDLPDPSYHGRYGPGPPAPYGGYMPRGAPRAQMQAPYQQAVPGSIPQQRVPRPLQRYPRY